MVIWTLCLLPILRIAGALAMAGLLCWTFWSLFKFVHRPEWGPLLVVAIMAVSLNQGVIASGFWKLSFTFILLAAAFGWWEGRSRRAGKGGPVPADDSPPMPMSGPAG